MSLFHHRRTNTPPATEPSQDNAKEASPMVDSLFADVSEFQTVVSDSYPYQIFSLRSNDGTYNDHNFAANYAWAAKAADSGKLACFIVYFYWRSNWQDAVNTHKSMVTQAGGPHPKMITMIDVESGGNPSGNQSDAINSTYSALTSWLGNTERVIGYANPSDFNTMWPNRPNGLRVIAADYSTNPNLPGQIAHQYTDGTGYDSALPQGAAPFGNCDMNSADGLSPEQFAAACGIGGVGADPVADTWVQFMGPGGKGWPQLGGHSLIDGVSAIGNALGLEGYTPNHNLSPMLLPRDTSGRARDIWIQLRGKEGKGWAQLGGRTLPDAIADIGKKLKIEGFEPSQPKK